MASLRETFEYIRSHGLTTKRHGAHRPPALPARIQFNTSTTFLNSNQTTLKPSSQAKNAYESWEES
ncbi:hypothetical protein AC578_5529 [Pseudocercospora eumusae]|uniref:Uncharacterized protein n=1 Tax=Pseudocercospora eumusae TaxID=321146 RepID=A0A139H7S4_9PEZI|nr:hypothetical protein AC578_5529 [Pseudocercospora eumusae]